MNYKYHAQSSIARFKNYYLKGVLAIYIVAFTSLYVQVQSLFGDNGLVPLRDYVSRLTASGKNDPQDMYNIVFLAPKLGLGYGTFVELLCILCVLIAFAALFAKRMVSSLTFGLLWYIYYSICSVGQGFMSFHSDLLLLEAGFITILLAPLLPYSKTFQSDHDIMTFFLVKWLVFRYFVGNVLSIYLEGDNAWYQLTALPMVAQGVQFPSVFSWHLYNAPLDYVKVLQAYCHTIKLCTPFLCMFDLKYTRLLAFYSLLFYALPSALLFNFGWSDILIAVCLLSYLKDSYFYPEKKYKQSTLRSFIDILVLGAYLGFVGFLMVRFYGLKYENSSIKAQAKFTPAQFKLLADHVVPVSFVVGILGLLSSAYVTFFRTTRRTSVIKTLIYSIIVTMLFFSTFPTLSRFAPGLENKVKSLAYTKNLSRMVAPLHLSNNYVLLSKVSQNYADGRTELQIQARTSSDDPTWQQYDLRYKPGQTSKHLARVVPHLPRVDLKMWYAARSSLQNNNWIQTLSYRLATNENDVIQTVSPGSKLFKANQVRVVALTYKYSSKNAGFWLQPSFKSEYMPPTTIENLKFAVKSNGISLTPSSKTPEGKLNSLDKLLNKYLEISSDYVRSVDPTIIIWSFFAISAMTMFR